MSTFVCGHGRTVDEGSDGLPECEADVRSLVVPEDGDERSRTLRKLIEAPLCVPFDAIHQKTVELVGRDVWTHEFARPDGLYEEARTQAHPDNLAQHVVDSAADIMGAEKIIVVPQIPQPDVT